MAHILFIYIQMRFTNLCRQLENEIGRQLIIHENLKLELFLLNGACVANQKSVNSKPKSDDTVYPDEQFAY